MPMQHYLGLSEYHYRQKHENFPVYYQPERLINAHMLLCGMSGTGKSFQSLRFLESAAQSGVEIDVFDVHEELDKLPGAIACKYSQATGYGYNPLVLDTDTHAGGVNRQVDFIVGLIKQLTPQFGAKQEAALRNILTDTYTANWIRQNDPKTWYRKKITEAERNAIVTAKRWGELRQYYPTIDDLMSYMTRKIVALTIGGDNKCAAAFDNLARLRTKLTGLQGKYAKASNDEDIQKLEGQILAAKEKCKEGYAEFIDAMKTGREIDDILKYDSVDVLTSVMQRLQLLNSTGIFRANEPPFGSSRVRVHQIKSLTTDQQVLFVKLRLREIFERRKQQGATTSGTELKHIIFLDEAHKYFSKESDDIINVLAKEARKFGIGLWCASQQPTEFPESFLTNVGATVLLGIHSSFWKRSASMLRISEDGLKYIKPKEVMAIKLQKDGEADPSFRNVIVPNPNTEAGRLANEAR
jgi:Helicase HerA, central domain